ncbi:MAG: hypothetical protein ACR2OB_07965 [Solirubrobacteraceae bacterium]
MLVVLGWEGGLVSGGCVMVGDVCVLAGGRGGGAGAAAGAGAVVRGTIAGAWVVMTAGGLTGIGAGVVRRRVSLRWWPADAVWGLRLWWVGDLLLMASGA